MQNYNKIFILLFAITLSSCGITYDIMVPKAEEKRRTYTSNTYNYDDFKMREEYKGETFITHLNTDEKSVLQEKHRASINKNGTLKGINEYIDDSENKFGPFQSYFEVNKAVSYSVIRSTSSMKGFNWKTPQTFTAKNHKPKTINLKKLIRIGPAIGNLYPLLGLGFFLENGHIWKMKKSYDVVLDPTNAYKEYCKNLFYLANLINETKSCSESKKEVKIQDSWVADVDYIVLLEKKYIKNYKIVKLSDWLPKKSTIEINQTHINEVISCIDKINQQEKFFASNNEVKVYFDIILAAEEKEKTEARNKALAEAYDAFLKKEVLCDNGENKLEQKDVWIFLAETHNGAMVSTKNNYQWILNKDEKVSFEVKNIGEITTQSTFEKDFYVKDFDYSGSYDLYCSRESALTKIKEIKQEQSSEIAKRQKAKKDAFESWIDEEVKCADNNKTIKKRYTWVIIKKNNKLYPYKIKNVKIDDYELLQICYVRFEYNGEMLQKYIGRNWFSSESQTKKEIENRKEDIKRIIEETAEKQRQENERQRQKDKQEEQVRENKRKEKQRLQEDANRPVSVGMNQRDVLNYLEKYKFTKYFQGKDMSITWGYVSSYNTNAIILTVGSNTRYFINPNVSCGYGSCRVAAMAVNNNQTFDFKVESDGSLYIDQVGYLKRIYKDPYE